MTQLVSSTEPHAGLSVRRGTLPVVTDAPPPTLLDVLQQRLPESSKTTLRKMLQGDRVRVNGAPERDAKREIGPGDRVEVTSKPARPLDPRVRIVFEDNDLIVIDKAAGLLTVATAEVLYETA